MEIKSKTAKPFVKWAGGKSQLIKDIDSKISSETHTSINANCLDVPFG